MSQNVNSHQFDNGLVLIAETMDWVESAAFSISLPAGCSHDPDDRLGLANFTCEMAQRGCGELNSRQFVERLDRLGVDRSASVTQVHTSYAAAMLADNLNEVLGLYADVLRQPHLPTDQLDDARAVCFHELNALEDDLAQRTMLRLRQQTYDAPWGRSPVGDEECLTNIDADDVREFHQANYTPHGAILSVAGKVDWPQLRDAVGRAFGGWTAVEQPEVAESPAPCGYLHLPHESSQTQIGVAYHTVPYRDEDYFRARGAVGVLSDGMSSRLFTEVRENRGLCYTVYASYHSRREEGRVFCYAGTSTDRAQETLDVTIAELVRLSDGIEESELSRLKARTKSALIMQQESSASRSAGMAADWYHLGRVRSMDEINQRIDELTCDSINDYVSSHPAKDFTVVTLGEKPLEVPVGVS